MQLSEIRSNVIMHKKWGMFLAFRKHFIYFRCVPPFSCLNTPTPSPIPHYLWLDFLGVYKWLLYCLIQPTSCVQQCVGRIRRVSLCILDMLLNLTNMDDSITSDFHTLCFDSEFNNLFENFTKMLRTKRMTSNRKLHF